MKKQMRILLIALFVLALTACGGQKQPSDSAAEPSKAADATKAPTSTPTAEPTPTEDPEDDLEDPEDDPSYTEGDLENYAPTEGTWRMDGDEAAASISMDGEGSYIAFYASGHVESTGYLLYVEDEEGGRYDMYDGEYGYINSFVFESDTEIRVGGEDGFVYVWENPDFE